MELPVKAVAGAASVAVLTVLAALGTSIARRDPIGSDVQIKPRMTETPSTRFAWASIGVGRPLLLLNGSGCPMAEWDPAFLEVLSKARRVLVFDYPELGMSGTAPGDWTIPNVADWIAELIRELSHRDRVDIAGWAFGSLVAQRLAVQYPDRVGKVVLMSANPGGSHALVGPEWAREAHHGESANDNTYLQTNYPLTPAAQKAGRDFLNRLSTANADGRYPTAVSPKATFRAMVDAEQEWLSFEQNLSDLRSVDRPVLILAGERDLLNPPENAQLLVGAIPEAQLKFYPGTGHSFVFQNPRKTAEDIIEFLNS